jgi:hypothetical protein
MGRLALDRPADSLLGDPDLNRLFLGGHVVGADSATAPLRPPGASESPA